MLAGMDESENTQNRRARRSNVLMAASIESSGTASTVTLRNLSSEGALVEGESLPIEGSSVLFRKKELRLNGHVAWVKGKRAGIAFDEKLDPETVLRHIPSPRPRTKLEFRRPGVTNHDLSPQERVLVERWAWAKAVTPIGE